METFLQLMSYLPPFVAIGRGLLCSAQLIMKNAAILSADVFVILILIYS
jgi:hypothetical protein